MPALTALLSKPIRTPTGEEVATLNDLVVRTVDTAPDNPDIYPPVVGLVARVKAPRGGSRQVFIPWDQVADMDVDGVTLKTPALNLRQFERREGEMLLEGAVLDRQVVDVEGRRVIRINDVDVAKSGDVFRLVAVDVGPGALVRRLPQGGRFSQFIEKRVTTRPPLIDWAQIAPINDGEVGEVRLRVPRDRLALMQPADIARVVEQLTPKQGAALLNDLDDERAADTLEELDDEQQGQVLREMDPERAADVLEEMEPDEAADALQNITVEKAADLLGRMEADEAADVRELLGYPEDSAGGIMTTWYVAVPDWVTAGAVVDTLRAQVKAAAEGKDDPLPDDLPEIYVVEEQEPPRRLPGARRAPSRPVNRAVRAMRAARNGHGASTGAVAVAPRNFTLWTEGKLVGVVSLRDLVLATPETPIAEVMRPPASVANPLDDERDAARIIADEDLVALPVVDDAGLLLGIVTVDDAIDVILPTAWKKRIPRRFH